MQFQRFFSSAYHYYTTQIWPNRNSIYLSVSQKIFFESWFSGNVFFANIIRFCFDIFSLMKWIYLNAATHVSGHERQVCCCVHSGRRRLHPVTREKESHSLALLCFVLMHAAGPPPLPLFSLPAKPRPQAPFGSPPKKYILYKY